MSELPQARPTHFVWAQGHPMHMETAQHQFTVTHFNLCHNEQFAGRGKDVRCNNRVIGQIIVEDYLDIGSRPHPPMVHAKSARRA
jgi:hypothetical protein